MRKITITLLASLLTLTAFAGPVSRQQALQEAKAYLQTQRNARGVSQTEALTLAYECQPKASRGVSNASPLYYVFNQGKQQGFIVVAGDDRVKPVLGYVDAGSFDINEVHEGMQWWLGALESTMTAVAKTPDDGRNFEVLSDNSGFKAYVEPLVKVNWGQGGPYNNRCPLDKGHNATGGNYPHSLVGCTAVAMSQVLSRWQYPAHPVGKISYTTNRHKMQIEEDLSTFVFDWDKMLPSYAGGKGTAAERDAVAELAYACGVATQMDYCSVASGAFLNSDQLEEHFGIDKGCNIITRYYFTKDEWDHIAKNELSNGRPIIYFGYSMDAGHAFVCDGYNQDGLFHINWGWDGSMNGYFALAELNSAVEHAGAPTDEAGSFNIDQEMIIGIQPKKDVETEVVQQLYFTNMVITSPRGTRNNVKLDVKGIYTDGNNFDGVITLGIFDKDGNFISKFGSVHKLALTGWNGKDVLTLGGALPSSLTPGVYTLRPICGKTVDDLAPMKGRQSSPYVSYLTMELKGALVALSKPEMSEAKITVVGEPVLMDGKAFVGISNPIEIKLRNDGALYNGPIVLQREGDGGQQRVFANNYIIGQGEELVIRANVKAPESGSRDKINIWIAGEDNDRFQNNGFEYVMVGSVEYDLTTPTSGSPMLQLNSCQIQNPKSTVYYGENLNINITLTNNGGFYGDKIFAFVFPPQGGTSIGSAQKKILLDKGQRISFDLNYAVNNLAPDKYFFQVFALDENNAYQALSTTAYYFEVKDAGVLTASNDDGFGVACYGHAFILPEQVKAGIVDAVDATNLHINYCYQPGDTIPAHTPIIYQCEKRGSYDYKVVLSNALSPQGNVLRTAVDEKGMTYAGEGDYWYYDFKTVRLDGKKYSGFFKRNASGSPFILRDNSVYLALPANQGQEKGYPFSQALTGIEDQLVDEGVKADAAIYTISGVRMNGPLQTLPKGLYIVGGKKVYVK